MGITFVPLEATGRGPSRTTACRARPNRCFSINRGGIMFKPAVHDAETRVMLERQVEALLNRR
jgi:hypothetical protein